MARPTTGAQYMAAAATRRLGAAAMGRPGSGTAVRTVTASRSPAQAMAPEPTGRSGLVRRDPSGPACSRRDRFGSMTSGERGLMADRPFVLLSAAMSADGYIDDA